MIAQILFTILLAAASFYFYLNIRKVKRNIALGKDFEPQGTANQRLRNMMLVAIGQGKMFTRPLAAIMHIIIYAGFILINVEVLEILIDGVFGTHRVFAQPLGKLYDVAIGFFEILAALVIAVCVVFLFRRHVIKVKRFTGFEMRAFPVKDAATILIVEIILMSCLIILNAADSQLQVAGAAHYIKAGSFPISSFLTPWFQGMDIHTLEIIERITWWGHIIGILIFLNYLPFSKHFHIIMAFPNTYYANADPKGKLTNMASVTTEVQLMMDPGAQVPDGYTPPSSFGVKDIFDLTRKNLMDAYTCTECGRCTSVCPANATGKLLSPRKVMMDTRDRLEEIGKNIDINGAFTTDGKNLHDYISEEELWACTTCQACVEICPVNINPMEIIVEMRRYKVMEQSSAPAELNNMFTNIENNGAPWQMSQSARFDWASEQ